MRPFTPKPFSAFYSAAEEAAARAVDEWKNEGGHTFAKSGYIVQTRGAELPYKVVFHHEDGSDSEQPCATIREGEEIIRRHTPVPRPESTFRDPGGAD